MKKIVYITAILVSIIIAFFCFLEPARMISPGHVISGHKSIEKNCLSCHQVFQGSTDKQCINCHKVRDIGVLNSKGEKILTPKIAFHHLLTKEECISCHVGHIGHIQINNNKGIKNFSHNLLSEEIRNKCISCHTKPRDTIHLNASDNCLTCHSLLKWKPASLNHEKFFRFDRNHPGSDCATCHTDKNNYKIYTCYGCHEHSENKIRREHEEEGIRDFSNCVKCHRSGNEHDIVSGEKGEHSEKGEHDD